MNAKIDISNVIIKTDRLVLRPWEMEDLQDFHRYASVDGVGQMAGWLPHESIDISREILNHFVEGKKTFALEYQGKVIGSVGIELYNEDTYPELEELHGRSLGYVLSRDYWGEGLMPEAVKAVVNYLFAVGKLDFILISHFVWNDRSRRVIEKNGFSYLKNGIHRTRYDTLEEVKEYILYRPDYTGEKIANNA